MLDVTLQTQIPGQQSWSLWAGSVQPEDSRSSLPSGAPDPGAGKEQAANGPRVGAHGGREEVDRLTLTLTHSETADLMVHPASTRWRCFTSQQEVVTMEMSPASVRPDVTFVGVCVCVRALWSTELRQSRPVRVSPGMWDTSLIYKS